MVHGVDSRLAGYFIAVADHGGLSQAARELHVSQPTVSAAMRTLERRLGVTLLQRGAAGAQLTPAGQAFLREARSAVARLDAAVEAARAAGGAVEDELRIGAVSTTTQLVGAVVAALAPAPHLEVHTYVGLEMRDALHFGDIDVALVHGTTDVPFEPGPGTRTHVLAAMPMLAALPAAHPLAGREHVRLAELAATPWVHIPRDVSPAHHDNIVAICSRHGFAPSIVARASSVQGLLELVSAGVGVCTVDALGRGMHTGDGVRYVPVPGEAHVVVAVTRAGGQRRAVMDFIAATRAQLEAMGGTSGGVRPAELSTR